MGKLKRLSCPGREVKMISKEVSNYFSLLGMVENVFLFRLEPVNFSNQEKKATTMGKIIKILEMYIWNTRREKTPRCLQV